MKNNKHSAIRCMCCISLILLFSMDVVAGPDDADCVACHQDFNHKEMEKTADDKCTTCHGPMRGHESRIITIGAHNKPIVHGPETGMQYPLYGKGEQSRLGTKPNEMIDIPAGNFIMGTDARMPDEGPEHTRHLDKYAIDKYEVTNAQYKAFIDATGRRSPKHFRNRTFPDGKADHPVVYVSWYDADAYCKWAGKRLPTDAEWEKAARGSQGQFFPWGDAFDVDKANTPQRWARLDMDGDTTPVGAFEEGRSPYGAYDMSGNVWEWTDSWYQAYPGNTHHTENYGEKYKTLKGGSWWDCSFYKCGISAPVYNRSFFLRSTKNSSFGFRCARDGE